MDNKPISANFHVNFLALPIYPSSEFLQMAKQKEAIATKKGQDEYATKILIPIMLNGKIIGDYCPDSKFFYNVNYFF